jgi:hypothetical protein
MAACFSLYERSLRAVCSTLLGLEERGKKFCLSRHPLWGRLLINQLFLWCGCFFCQLQNAALDDGHSVTFVMRWSTLNSSARTINEWNPILPRAQKVFIFIHSVFRRNKFLKFAIWEGEQQKMATVVSNGFFACFMTNREWIYILKA